jgi:molecular chaperone Hsp33
LTLAGFSGHHGGMIKEPLSTDVLASLSGIACDGMDILLLEHGSVRATILNASRLVNEMRVNHRLGILESLALGYAYMGALLCTTQMKGTDRMTLAMDCDGPLAGFAVEGNAEGQVKGYLKVDQIPLDHPLENFDLAPFIGGGRLTVTKTLSNTTQPFTGTIELAHGSIARDLTRYFQLSEQIQTAIALSIWFDPAGAIRGAGGLFLQALPGAEEQILEDLDDWITEIPSIGKLLANGHTPTGIMREHFRAFHPELVGSRAAEFFCHCDSRRFLAYLRSLPETERAALRAHDPEKVVIHCHNCGTEYFFPHEELG